MQCMDYGVYCILLFLSGTYALFRMSLVSVEVSQTKRKNLNVMPADAVIGPWRTMRIRFRSRRLKI